MHPFIRYLANSLGVVLARRVVDDTHVFDGKTLAMHYQPWRRSHPVDYSDHDLLHELAHYFVATPEQRDLPEYGLGYVALTGQALCPDVVDFDEAQIQEAIVQLLCCYWGEKYGISAAMSNEPDYVDDWSVYLAMKIREAVTVPTYQCGTKIEYHGERRMWEGLIRFHRLKEITF